MSNQTNQAAETAITQPTVVAGLGYPMGRDEVSNQPTGWIQRDTEEETSHIDLDKKVSRETF